MRPKLAWKIRTGTERLLVLSDPQLPRSSRSLSCICEQESHDSPSGSAGADPAIRPGLSLAGDRSQIQAVSDNEKVTDSAEECESE
jgi:hypothetical protein